MPPRLSGQPSILGVAFLLGIERQEKLKKFAILIRKPRSHVRILIYRTWPIGKSETNVFLELIPTQGKLRQRKIDT